MQVNWEGRIVDAALRTLVVEVSGARILSIPPSIRDVYIVHSDAQHGAANRLREQVLTGVAQELRGPLSAVADILDSLESEHRKFSEHDIDPMILCSARRNVLGLRDLMADLLNRRQQSGGQGPRRSASGCVSHDRQGRTPGRAATQRPAGATHRVRADTRFLPYAGRSALRAASDGPSAQECLAVPSGPPAHSGMDRARRRTGPCHGRQSLPRHTGRAASEPFRAILSGAARLRRARDRPRAGDRQGDHRGPRWQCRG